MDSPSQTDSADPWPDQTVTEDVDRDGLSRRTMSTAQQTPSRSKSPRLTRSVTTPAFSTHQSLSASPLPSRETSPIRPSLPAVKFGTTGLPRSRKNSTDRSPHRTPSHTPTTIQSVPSAAAVQRALAAVGHQKLPSPTTPHFGSDVSEPRKSSRTNNSSTGQLRLTSPPSVGRLQSPSSRTPEQQQQQAPAIVVNNASSKPTSGIETIQEEDDSPMSDIMYPGRSAIGVGSVLETVQEDSPMVSLDSEMPTSSSQRPFTIQEDPDEDNPDMASSQTTAGTASSKPTAESGSGSDDAVERKGKEKEKLPETQKSAPASVAASRKPSSTQLAPSKPPTIQPRRSFQHLNQSRNKAQNEGSVKSMTVETETVSNPDLLIADREGRSASVRLDGTGSIRAKPSNETIRPKKDKKRIRKAPSITSGTASTKADIFEAKVASAVDEAANSSDSEETFVYESNPPETRSGRSIHAHRYHHSRTPSAASQGSQSADRQYRSQHFGVAGKKSMKFTNANQVRDPDDDDGASAYPSNTGRSSHRHHHHIARIGRLHNAPIDSDSPISNAAKSPRTRNFNSWRTHGARTTQEQDSSLPHMPDKAASANIYDLSNSVDADDEFTPLLMTVDRMARNDPRRRGARFVRADLYQPSPWSKCMSYLKYSCLTLLITAVVILIVGAMILCNKTLWDVHIRDMRNVLASEQELFFELEVHAVNPNLVDVSIAESDLDVFAKSKYVGTTEMWRDGSIPGIDKPGIQHNGIMAMVHGHGIDEGTDPIEEPGAGTHTMLLGRVHEFDSPLIFESSPFYHTYRTSSAGLRLGKPGNKTEEGGSRRWENVMQHPFDLLVRGRVRYYLPLSSKEHYVTVSASATVKPDKPIDEGDGSGGSTNGTVRIGIKAARNRKLFWA